MSSAIPPIPLPATKLLSASFHTSASSINSPNSTFNSINRENLPAAQDKEQLGSNEFLNKDKSIKSTPRLDTTRSNGSKASVISSETTPSPSSIESHSSISSFDSGENSADHAESSKVPRKRRTMTVVLLQQDQNSGLGSKKAVPSGRSLPRNSKTKSMSSFAKRARNVNRQVYQTTRVMHNRPSKVKGRPASANPKLLRSKRGGHTSTHAGGLKSQPNSNTYGMDALPAKDRPQSAPMRRLAGKRPTATKSKHEKKILLPKQGGWMAKEAQNTHLSKQKREKRGQEKRRRKRGVRKKVPVIRRGDSQSSAFNTTSNSSSVVSNNSFGSTEMIYESNFIPSFTPTTKHLDKTGIKKSRARPNSAPLHRSKPRASTTKLPSTMRSNSPDHKSVSKHLHAKHRPRGGSNSIRKKKNDHRRSSPKKRRKSPLRTENTGSKNVNEQNKATHKFVLRSIVRVQSIIRMYLAKLHTQRMLLTKFGETWKAIEAESAIKIQCAFRKRLAITRRLEMARENQSTVTRRARKSFYRLLRKIKNSLFRRPAKESNVKMDVVSDIKREQSSIKTVVPDNSAKQGATEHQARIRKIVKIQSVVRSHQAQHKL